MRYNRLCRSLQDIGIFIPENENVYDHISVDTDWYKSVYTYTESQKLLAEEFIEVEGKTRPRGVTGITDVVTPLLVFDFDDEKNLASAQQSTLQLVTRLIEAGIEKEAIQICFSGKKGFSVVVETTEELSPDQHKAVAKKFAKDLPHLDPKMYNASRIMRIPFTRHQDTKLHKIPLTLNELSEASIEEIQTWAEKEYEPNIPETWKPIKIPHGVLEVTEDKATSSDLPAIFDLSKKPSWLSNWKYALLNGYFPKGTRSYALMILAATFKNQGLPKDIAYRMLKGVAEMQAKLFNSERFPDRELFTRVLSQVYGPFWKGGTYAEESFPDDLKEFLVSQNIPRNNAEKTGDNALVSIDDVYSTFENFAENIEKNTIKTGIKEFDEKFRITTSMLVGILAAPAAGKCLGKGTKVRMYSGELKNVEDIKVGELLMGDDSTPRKVLSTCKGIEQLYEVQQKNGNPYVVNESHILSLKCSAGFTDERYGFIKGEIRDINIKDYLNSTKALKKYFKGYKVGIEYNKKNVKIDPYFLGMWLGDGTSYRPTITNTDQEVIDYCSFVAMRDYSLVAKHTDNNLQHHFTIKNYGGPNLKNPLLEDLKYYNLIRNKHIPFDYLINDRQTRLELLAGIIDSDGCRIEKGYIIAFKDKTLTDNTVELIRSLGFKASVSIVDRHQVFHCKKKTYEGQYFIHRIYMSGENLKDIPCKIFRKKTKDYKLLTNPLLTKINIKKLDVGEYYGFEIDGNKRFLLEDFTVTHNTSLLLQILESNSMRNEEAILFSLDMGSPLIYQRLAQRVSGFNSDDLFEIFKKNDQVKKRNIREEIKKRFENTHFCFKTGSSVEEMKQYVIDYQQRTGKKVRIIAVDYLEKIMGGFADATANSAAAAAKLQGMANELDACVIVLLQPQKAAGDPSEPLTSYRRIKGASVIEQDCRFVMSIYRPGYSPKSFEDDKFLSINVLKNTMGTLGQVDCSWDGLRGQISELDDAGYDDLAALKKRREAEKKAEEEDTSW